MSRPPSGRADRRRTLSQNFLRDQRAIATFLGALPPADGLPAVEVGAGDGSLTGRLAAHFGTLDAWELDPVMARRVPPAPGLTVHTGDFLTAPAPGGPFHLAGNVPFGSTSAVVTWAIGEPGLRTATLITQLEYARKRTGDYGRWSRTTVATWPWLDWRLAGRIGRAAFRPVPAVDAAVLSIVRRPQPLLDERLRAAWERAVELGFEGRGGSLFASLRALYQPRPLTAVFDAVGVERTAVVAFVPPDRWVELVTRLETRPPPPPRDPRRGRPSRPSRRAS